MINNSKFYIKPLCNGKIVNYPPFKNGLYPEERFLEIYKEKQPNCKRKYIPALWTNFQMNFVNGRHGWRDQNIQKEMQNSLDEWIEENPSNNDYFTVIQHDDGCNLRLPQNTIIYGCCTGDIPIPLIYEDTTNYLENIPKKKFNDKEIVCSFVGTVRTSGVRDKLLQYFKLNNNFKLFDTGGWNINVATDRQDNFINTTINSKFALAPRGYGKSSFRFFEIFKLGTIPIYVWDDKNWLPFKEKIDYKRLCLTFNIREISKIEETILSIDDNKYNDMLSYYEEIKHLFDVEGCCNYILLLENNN